MLRNGERIGLKGLCRQLAPELFKYGLSMVRDKDFIQDCGLDVFIDLWKYHIRY